MKQGVPIYFPRGYQLVHYRTCAMQNTHTVALPIQARAGTRVIADTSFTLIDSDWRQLGQRDDRATSIFLGRDFLTESHAIYDDPLTQRIGFDLD